MWTKTAAAARLNLDQLLVAVIMSRPLLVSAAQLKTQCRPTEQISCISSPMQINLNLFHPLLPQSTKTNIPGMKLWVKIEIKIRFLEKGKVKY